MGFEDTKKRRALRATAWSAGVAALVLLASPWLGEPLDVGRILARQSPDFEILFELRLSRTLLGLIAGACLSLAGVLFQALLRDALATPYTLGVSSAASLGAVLAIVCNWDQVLGFPAVWASALLFAGAVLWLIIALAAKGMRLSSFTLLLVGITMNSICAALILLLHSLASFTHSFAVTRWLMGALDSASYQALGWLAVGVAAPVFVILRLSRQWNLMAFGEVWAAGRGASPQQLLFIGYVSGSILAASVTALTGPIAFVGLIVPHMLRRALGADHRILMPCSLLLGAAFLALCDALARAATAPVEVPVGVVTALLGGPFFIWLLWNGPRSE
jgi:iron complex transport system permease protein